jgi:hypothetical protein
MAERISRMLASALSSLSVLLPKCQC